MKRFKEWRGRRIQAQIDKITARMAVLRETQFRLDPDSPEAEAMNAYRVRLFWQRNDLYAKLASTKES